MGLCKQTIYGHVFFFFFCLNGEKEKSKLLLIPITLWVHTRTHTVCLYQNIIMPSDYKGRVNIFYSKTPEVQSVLNLQTLLRRQVSILTHFNLKVNSYWNTNIYYRLCCRSLSEKLPILSV